MKMERRRWYGFVYQDEGAGTAPARLLKLELVRADWFDRTWQVLKATPDGRLLEDLAYTLGQLPFEELYRALNPSETAALARLHGRFAAEMVTEHKFAPVALLEIMAGPSQLPPTEPLEGSWVEMTLGPGELLRPLRNVATEGEAILSEIGLTPAADLPPTIHRKENKLRLLAGESDKPLGPMLSALHYPQVWRGDEDWMGWVKKAGICESGKLHLHTTSGYRKIRAPDHDEWEFDRFRAGPRFGDPSDFTRLRPFSVTVDPARRRRWTSTTRGIPDERGGGGEPGPGGHGPGPGIPDPAHWLPSGEGYERSGGVVAMESTVVAGAGRLSSASAGPVAQAHAAGRYQSFVGANLVGSGNNLAVWNGRGELVAYVDYGYPLRVNRATYPSPVAFPCLCSDPIMVLTHWDYDHYAMVRYVPDALRRRWIVPQQVMGSVSMRDLYVRILLEAGNGGELYLWQGRAGFVVTEFGVLVRAQGPATNDDCLVAYVRAVDGAAPAASTLPSACGPRLSPPAVSRPVTGVLSGEPIIVPTTLANGLDGEWIDGAVTSPFSGHEVVVPAGSHPDFPVLTASATGVPRTLQHGGTATWIAPAGTRVRGRTVTPYIPSWGGGGWAVSPADFVASGGFIIDFPNWSANGAPRGSLVISPTPGSPWRPVPGSLHPGWTQVPAAGRGSWAPAWGTGLGPCWEIPLANASGWPLPGGAAQLPLQSSPDGPPFGADERYVLLPGDAGFQHIDQHANPPVVVGLMAAHHGADTWIGHGGVGTQDIPPAPGSSIAASLQPCEQIIYSYGTRLRGPRRGEHCYGHPSDTAIGAYRSRGWGVTDPHANGDPFTRLNTAPQDFRSDQPYDPLQLRHDPGTGLGCRSSRCAQRNGHRSGNAALGWDGASDGPIQQDRVPSGVPTAPGKLRRSCPRCARTRTFFY